jgi:hypothetical protein
MELFRALDWILSSERLIPMEARGLHREMLTQYVLRGELWTDQSSVRRVCGCEIEEWERCWPTVSKLWYADEDGEHIHPLESFSVGRERPQREAIPLSIRNAVLARDENRCRLCGRGDNLHIDHVLPYSKGGPSSIENLQVLCQTCNLRKGAR